MRMQECERVKVRERHKNSARNRQRKRDTGMCFCCVKMSGKSEDRRTCKKNDAIVFLTICNDTLVINDNLNFGANTEANTLA